MGYYSHGADDDEYVHPDGCVGEPSVFLQCPDLAEEEPCQSEDETADCVAELEFGDLRERLAVADDDGANIAEEL